MNVSITRLITFIGIIITCTHIFACIWCFISTYDYPNWVFQKGIQNESRGRMYLFAFYWAVYTMFTVGYGDVQPVNNGERIVSILWMLIGVSFYSFLIGIMSSLLNVKNSKARILKDKHSLINDFCKEANLDPSINLRMKKLLGYRTKNYFFSMFDSNSLLEALPHSLRYEIGMYMNNCALQKFNLFCLFDPVLLANLIRHFQPMLVEHNEIIYKKGDRADKMYFVVEGRVEYVMVKFHIGYSSYTAGSYFGDYETIFRIARKHTAHSKLNTHLLTLHKGIYQEMIEGDFPEIAYRMQEYAEYKQKKAMKNSKRALSITDNKAFLLHKSIESEIKQKIKFTQLSTIYGTGTIPSNSFYNHSCTSSIITPLQGLRKDSAQDNTPCSSLDIQSLNESNECRRFSLLAVPKQNENRRVSLFQQQFEKSNCNITVIAEEDVSRIYNSPPDSSQLHLDTETFYIEFEPPKGSSNETLLAEIEEIQDKLNLVFNGK